MGFDLWSTLGVSAGTGVLIALGGVTLAATMAAWRVWRSRSQSRAYGIRLGDDA